MGFFDGDGGAGADGNAAAVGGGVGRDQDAAGGVENGLGAGAGAAAVVGGGIAPDLEDVGARGGHFAPGSRQDKDAAAIAGRIAADAAVHEFICPGAARVAGDAAAAVGSVMAAVFSMVQSLIREPRQAIPAP